ncbi:sensor histidine kinase KdpD [Mesoflavibacter zeaxanthinifaciens]|uniref:sensor histidine kinase n=1 Tax=Mesoflavibacter zeaxanthinifaciens TaxID=393060 RepID=UPI0026EEB593|nr:HAMP domain-containing sensor histidine kinase [Mesoflavibacter zeaxanthinifaciens]
MNKRVFLALVVLMSLSLIGIILVQAYYINNSLRNTEEQFNFNVKKALSYVSKTIEDQEYNKHLFWVTKSIQESGTKADTTAILNFYVEQKNRDNNETLIYRNGILEENFKLSSALFDIGLDSINVKRILSEKETKVVDNNLVEGGTSLTALLSEISTKEYAEVFSKNSYEEFAYRRPIHKRVTVDEINRLLSLKLLEDDIDIDYEFAIYSNELATKVKTEDFEKNEGATFSVPIFVNKNDKNNYRLLVNFPDRKEFILSSIMTMLILSIVFTSVIILAYSSALYQLIKQRQISQIKTDFINNMTHEFKTPIATINLALDSIKNPKILEDKDKVLRYLGMIREENKRMHAQVENVLRISKLEKNELNISKERVDLHELVEEAIMHVELIIEDRGGEITVNLNADKTSVLANDSHFTNVLVNILDNAIKYSPQAPKIIVTTEVVGNNILVHVKDHGSGMSKSAQKRVFEKFYREHTGDIHNVKGHGLGLAYVKRIIEDHQGHISVESEKDKGSTFTIKLPLIS